MEWVLAEALLSQSRDPRALLGALCQGEASAERVETLRFLLQRLEDEEARGSGGAGALPEAAREVAAGYLVPLLRSLRGRPAGGPDPSLQPRHRRRLLRAAGAALRSCVRLAGRPQLAAALAEEALRDLLAGWRAPGAEAAVEVLAAVGPCLRPREDGPLLERVAGAAVALALGGGGDGDEAGPAEDAAALVAGRLLPVLVQCGGAALRAVWGGLAAPGASPGSGRVEEKLLVLSALAEKLLPEPGGDRTRGAREAGPDARRCWRFWRTVQAGLGQADALTRKRARYLLQRAVEVSAELGADCTCGPQEGNGKTRNDFCTNLVIIGGKMLCDWLRVNESYFKPSPTCSSIGLHKTSLNAYVKSIVQEYVKSSAWERENCFMPDWFEAKLVSLMVLLAVDVEGMKTQYSGKQRTENVLRIFLDPLLDVLMKFGTNAYMPLLKTDRCLQLLLKLLNTCRLKGSSAQDDEVSTVLQNFFMSTTESISEFILRRLTMNELNSVSDLDRCHLYLMVLTELINLHLKVGWKRGNPIWRVISLLKNASIQHLQEMDSGQEPTVGSQIQRVVSMAALAMVCEAIDQKPELQLDSLHAGPLESFLSSLQLNQMLQKPHAEEQSSYAHPSECSSVLEESSSSQGWGKIVAQYIHDQWVCLSFLLKKYHTLIPTTGSEILEPFLPAVQMPIRTLQSALEALTVLSSDQVLPVFHCLKVLVPKLLTSSESLCIESFDMAWKIISSLSNTQLIFWPNLKAFVQFVFDNKVLTIAAKIKGQAYFKIKEIMYKIIEMSAIKTGVFNTLISYCCQSWVVSASNVSQGSLSSAKNYSELILEACIFGTVFRRDQRLVQDVQTFIENLGHDCAANIVMENTKREDHYVRICAVKFLCLLDGSNMSHKLFMEDLAIKLLDKDELVSKSKKRYYVNSLQHRVKNRVWQTLLVLFPRLDQNFLNGIIDRIFQAGFTNNQASIKYFIEWIIILILHKFPQFLPKFWDCFSYGEENLKTSICTFLAVLSHLDIITQNIPEKKLILKQALIVVLQWCFNHNFSVRLYALVALKKLWTVCKVLSVEEFDALTPVIESSLHQVESMHGAGNAKKNWQRIQEHFFFAAFHPLKDYCLETIFYILPRLSGLIEDEWITIDKFTRFTDVPLAAGFQWYLSQTQLSKLKPGDWSQQDIGTNLVEADNQAEWTDVQKKIIPWNSRVPDLDLELLFQDRAARLGKSISRLIVVASLIDKPTNLGGLCRTCEVFGASVLVVGSLQCISDKQFQHLSVSAEQWLPLVEVKPPQLIDYLQQKKTEGYTIIGVEQTARSLDLTQYCFPEKSLLLLGNEREGIPANLIQQLDVCVEIPQQGIIRSLNVHVSGALLIWEYTRQQLLSHGDTKP
ncbi:TARBP1 isoform 6 [Pan troglodytes]|uniref:tRNA (guanosine(18)-2'-O)-methyltransferase TARBP1 n=1 Tax=Pan troglodytes TaxID=9598 RepID=A0A2J8M6Q9_PANTR|nr:TARBP1 isoform 6 [Pan troglodytes]